MLAQQKEAVSALIQKALAELGQPDAPVVLERPKSPEHGDVASLGVRFVNVYMESAL